MRGQERRKRKHAPTPPRMSSVLSFPFPFCFHPPTLFRCGGSGRVASSATLADAPCRTAPRVPACRLYGHCCRRQMSSGVLGSRFPSFCGRRASPDTSRDRQASVPSDARFPAGMSGSLPALPAVLRDAEPIFAPQIHATAGTRPACRRETNAAKESEPTDQKDK